MRLPTAEWVESDPALGGTELGADAAATGAKSFHVPGLLHLQSFAQVRADRLGR